MPLLVLGADGCGLMSKPSSPETEKHSFLKIKILVEQVLGWNMHSC